MAFEGLDVISKSETVAVQKPENKVEKPTQPEPRKSIWNFDFEDRFLSLIHI